MATERLIPAIVGPTASGKSELGIRLALDGEGEIINGEIINGEIINLDSVQVYRRVYIATAKVPVEQRRGVPHHLIDIVEPTENFTAGEYARLASATLRDVESRGRTAILVGGTGFYLRALVSPLFESPKTDLKLRERLIRIGERRGREHLHQLLSRVDRKAAERLGPRDSSRVMRAIEVYFQTGRMMSDAQVRVPPPPDFAARVRVIALSPPRDALYDLINQRAERMFEGGLVEEVQSLARAGVPLTAKAFQAHGYRRVVEYLEGARTREDALNQMKLDTRHYAKRQLSWWRAWPGVKWIYRFGNDPQAFEEAREYLETQV